jgi:phage protein D
MPFQKYMPDVSITIDGSRQNDLEDAVVDVLVDDALDGLSMLRLTIFDKPDDRTLKFKWLDSSELDPAAGKEISVSLDYVESTEKAREPLFKGFITALSPNFLSSGIPSISIEGYDHSYKLQKICSKKSFDNIDDYSKIVEILASDAGIGIGKVDSTGIIPKTSISINSQQSNYLFIRKLADRYGYYFYVRNKKIYFLNPAKITSNPIGLQWGSDITSFSPRMSASQVVTSVTVYGPSPERSKEPVTGTAAIKDAEYWESGKKSGAKRLGSGGLGPVDVRIHSYQLSSNSEAAAIAKGIMFRANSSFIEGECQCIGNPAIRACSDARISGVSSRFDGIYRVKRARHALNNDGYITTLDLMRGGA